LQLTPGPDGRAICSVKEECVQSLSRGVSNALRLANPFIRDPFDLRFS